MIANEKTFSFASWLFLTIPTPLDGRRKYILNWFYFVQSILADRYDHKRELWVISLESFQALNLRVNSFSYSFFSTTIEV